MVLRVHPVEPLLRAGADGFLGIAEHFAPACRVINSSFVEVPVPEAVVGRSGSQCIPLLALSHRLGHFSLPPVRQRQLLASLVKLLATLAQRLQHVLVVEGLTEQGLPLEVGVLPEEARIERDRHRQDPPVNVLARHREVHHDIALAGHLEKLYRGEGFDPVGRRAHCERTTSRIERADHFELGPAGLACALWPGLRALAIGAVPVRADPAQVEVRFCPDGVLVVPAGLGAVRVVLPQREYAGDRLSAPEPPERAWVSFVAPEQVEADFMLVADCLAKFVVGVVALV